MGSVTQIEFDGLEVRLLDDKGQALMQAPAVSGRPLLQDPGFSSLKDMGPLPEGRYRILKQHIESRLSLWDPNNIAWPRGYGYNRVTLLPEAQTELHGRSGFFLHGSFMGNGYGSAGCIDLNTEDGRIFDLLRSDGAETISVTVKYADELKESLHPVFQDHAELDTLRNNALALLSDALRTQPEMAANQEFVSGVAGVLGQDGLRSVLNNAPGRQDTGLRNGFDVFGNTPEAPLAAPDLPTSDPGLDDRTGLQDEIPLSGWQPVPGAASILPPRLAGASEAGPQDGTVLPLAGDGQAGIDGSADTLETVAQETVGPGTFEEAPGPAAPVPDATPPVSDPLLPFVPAPTSYDTFLRLGTTPEMEARGVADYNSILQESYLDMNGDRDAAEALARERFLDVWRPSKFAPVPAGTLLPYPVESVYPPSGEEGHDYVENHARVILEELGLKPGRIFLSPNERTGSDWKRGAADSRGHGPRLTLSFEDHHGQRHVVTDAFQAKVPRAAETEALETAGPQPGQEQ